MKGILEQLVGSPLLIGLSIALFISYSITTFDKRIIQAKRSGVLPPDHLDLPAWVAVFHVLDWVLLVTMLIINWKVALFVWACFFALKILPVLETVGNVLRAPFRTSRNI
jgi:hypothetical protein